MNVITSSLSLFHATEMRPRVKDAEVRNAPDKTAPAKIDNVAPSEGVKPSAPMALAGKSLLHASSLVDAMRQGDIAPTDMRHSENTAAFDGAQIMHQRLVSSYAKHARETEDQDRPQSTSAAVTA